MSTTRRGAQVEEAARRHLQRSGLQHLHSNFQAKTGELDLIMLDAECVVFVEVRYRQSQRYGGGATSIDFRKQQRLRKTASFYLLTHPELSGQPCRFDVISASGSPADPVLQWIRRAF